MLMLMLITVVLIIGGIIALIANAGKGAEAAAQARKTHREALIEQHSLDHVLTGRGASFLGIRTKARMMVIFDGTRSYEVPYKSLRAVSLTPITETISESTGEQHMNRGSQLIGAGLGAAVAGPAGLIVGGLSGSSTSSTSASSRENLADLELELFLRCDSLPRFVLCAGQVGTFGNQLVTYDQEQNFKDMAARLVNVVEECQR